MFFMLLHCAGCMSYLRIVKCIIMKSGGNSLSAAQESRVTEFGGS